VSDVWTLVALVSLAVVAGLLADRLRRRREEARAVLKGMRSVISGDPDAAIEALSDAARLGTAQAVETYLALGQLFRRTGDLARAVRLHRNMLLGPGLPVARRPEVERELAEDYRRSGMLDLAAELYRKLAPEDPRAAEGLRDVLVDAGDLDGAIAQQRHVAAAAPRREGDAPAEADPVLAHLLAARARARLARDPAAAAADAEEGLRADARSADAALALAEAEAARGRVAAAEGALVRALDAQPSAAVLAWTALAALPPARAAALVEGRLARAPEDAALHLLHGRALHRAGDGPAALAAVRRALELDRTGEVTLAMRELLREAEAPGPGELAARHDLLVAALLRRAPALRCGRCGAAAAVRSFRCARCGAFDPYA
jgi:lipopolysaccharide biosynthesis regulator YciM